MSFAFLVTLFPLPLERSCFHRYFKQGPQEQFLINAATLIRGLTEDATEPGKRFDNEKNCHIHSDVSLLQ